MTAEGVEYGVLGPLIAVAGGEPVELGGRVQRAMLAGFLLHANEPVSSDRLIELVWDERPPQSAAHAVSVYVSKLRKLLGEEAIVRSHGGYVLRVAPGALDLDRFEGLARQAREELALGDPAHACTLLDEALSLWRGEPLTDVELGSSARSAVSRLDELRQAAVVARAEALLALGRHVEVIPELERLTAEQPHDERLCGLLMLALYRAGRQGDALARYQAARGALAEELGIEPSASLQALERRILAGDPTLELDLGEPDTVRSVVVLPARLDQLEQLTMISEPFALSQNPHEVILTWIEQPGSVREVSNALADATSLLSRLRAQLVEKGARARVATFTAADPVDDSLRLARRPEVDLLVLGRELAELDDGRFDPALAGIVAAAPCDVAVWFRRDDEPAAASDGPIVVPFGALENDWTALELAAWIATTTGRRLVVVGAGNGAEGIGRDASRLLADAGLLIQRASGVVAEPRLAEPSRSGLLAAVADAGLVVAGLSERWMSEGLGETRLELASSAPAPVLFVRRGRRPGGLSPPESVTLYRWSVTASR